MIKDDADDAMVDFRSRPQEQVKRRGNSKTRTQSTAEKTTADIESADSHDKKTLQARRAARPAGGRSSIVYLVFCVSLPWLFYWVYFGSGRGSAPPPSPTQRESNAKAASAPASSGACGGGNIGNGICAKPSLCCSQLGFCGTTPAHCAKKSDAQAIPVVPIPPKPEAKSSGSVNTPADGELNPSKYTGVLSSYNWNKCVQGPPNPKNKVEITEAVEPLWLPAYPTSIASAPYADFINVLTGVFQGAKTYYRKSRSLKRCHLTQPVIVGAITCEAVHPIVPMSNPHPSAQAKNFGKVILLALRNPLTVFPAHNQAKAEAYHGQKGQVSKEDWEKFRDQYVGDDENSHLFNEWKGFIEEWRNMQPYSVAAYLPFEHWTDMTKGPVMVGEFSRILKKEGFPVLYNIDNDEAAVELGCMWYKHVYEPMIEDEKKREGWYESDYTLPQLKMLESEMNKYIDAIIQTPNGGRPGDEQLVAILQEYRQAIREKLEGKLSNQ